MAVSANLCIIQPDSEPGTNMPKQLFKKYLPSPDELKKNRSFGVLGEMLSDPNLWHINRRSLAGAAFIGVFSAMMPVPLQMLLAAALAIKFHCNLPMSVVLVWISNPFTYVPIFYFNYRVGAWLMDITPRTDDGVTVAWLVQQLMPLWMGSIATGIVFGSAAFIATRLVWRLAVVRNWNLRRLRILRKKDTFQD